MFALLFVYVSPRVQAEDPAPTIRILKEPEVLSLLTTTMQQQYVKDKGDLELAFTQVWSDPIVPNEPLTVKILEVPTSGVTPSFIVRFQLRTATQTVGTFQMTVQAHVWREIWVAHSALHRGETLADADVARDRYDVINIREALAQFSAGETTLEIAEPVSSGAPLLARAVKARAIVHRGQVANALLQDGALSITTKVEVLEDGAPGQLIRARNMISKRDLTGRVMDDQTVLISL